MEEFLTNHIAVALADGGNNHRSGGISSQYVIGADIELVLRCFSLPLKLAIFVIIVFCYTVAAMLLMFLATHFEYFYTIQYHTCIQNTMQKVCTTPQNALKGIVVTSFAEEINGCKGKHV